MHNDVRRFLDMEARVDEEEDLSEEEEYQSAEQDLEELFINDGMDMASRNLNHAYATRNIDDDEEDAFNALIARLDARANDRLRVRTPVNDAEDETTSRERMARLPSDDDFPLWKVGCRIGLEDAAIVSLLHNAKETHRLRSAFTRGSIHGCIYVEGVMDSALLSLLSSTPGILRAHQGIKRDMVDPTNQLQLLTMKNIKVDVSVGSWVLVKRGLYKGDVGFVSNTSSWGARVLLVPRLDFTSGKSHKRKASIVVPDAKLFNPDLARQLISAPVIQRSNDLFFIGLSEFEHGLLAKDYDYLSITNTVKDIPYSHFSLFRCSNHPDVLQSRMPRPREWRLRENDEVMIRVPGPLDENKAGWIPAVLMKMETYYAEAEQCTFEDGCKILCTHQVSWHNIRKGVEVGQLVEVMSGANLGLTGWIVSIHEDQAYIAKTLGDGRVVISGETTSGQTTEKDLVSEADQVLQGNPGTITAEELQPNLAPASGQVQEGGGGLAFTKGIEAKANQETDEMTETVEHFVVFVNLLDVSADLFTPQNNAASTPSTVPYLKNSPKHPWCGLEVLIHRHHHPRKGETGQIKEVHYQEEGHTLQIEIQLTRYDPTAPFQRITVDYHDIIESSSLNELAVYCDPGPSFYRPESRLKPVQLRNTHVSTASGSGTPMYSQPTSTPAWDPSSRTPFPVLRLYSPPRMLDSSSPTSANMETATPSASTFACKHVLLHPKLANISLNVIMDGGPFNKKAVVASAGWVADELVIRMRKLTAWETVADPTWVTPKYANPIHDNGLLVVIKGEHCGKFVRRIRHKKIAEAMNVLVATVTRSKNARDVLTGEQIMLEVDHLCSAHETKKERDLNYNLMSALKEQYKNKTL